MKTSSRASRRLLFVGESQVRHTIGKYTLGMNCHYYESLVDLERDQPDHAYDIAVVSYWNSDSESVKAARNLTSFLRKTPIFIVSILSDNKEKILRYEKGSIFKECVSPEEAVGHIIKGNQIRESILNIH